MKLRPLDMKDDSFMLEWIHDDNVIKYMQTDFKYMNINDCKHFIENSKNNDLDIHFAIVDDNDEYMEL